MHGFPNPVWLVLGVSSIALGLWLGTGPLRTLWVAGYWLGMLVMSFLVEMVGVEFGRTMVAYLVLFAIPYVVARLLSRNWPSRRSQK